MYEYKNHKQAILEESEIPDLVKMYRRVVQATIDDGIAIAGNVTGVGDAWENLARLDYLVECGLIQNFGSRINCDAQRWTFTAVDFQKGKQS